MAKPRVYGQQVQVKIYNDLNTKTPFVIDFDSINIDAKISKPNYRTIGKSVTTNQPVLEGFTITLERSKRDDFLVEFYYLLNEAHKGRMRTFEVIIEKSTNHTFQASEIIPEKEFASLGIAQPLFDVGVQYLVEQAKSLRNLATNTAQSFIANNQVSRNVANAIRGNTFLEEIKKRYENQLLASIAMQTFVEKTYYVNCTIESFSSSDKANELSTETITFSASDMIKGSDTHAMQSYFDTLMYKYYDKVEMQYKNEIQKAIIGLTNFANNIGQAINSASSSLNKAMGVNIIPQFDVKGLLQLIRSIK